MAKGDVLVRLDNVVKHFPIRGGVLLRQVDSVKAVNGVSFDIREGETFGLVGESGCGKSTLGSVVLGLDAPTSGSVTFDGKDVHKARGAQRRDLHRQMQVVFQDPFESLNPRMTVEEIVGEGLRIHGGLSKEEIHERVMEMLNVVNLKGFEKRTVSSLSGGQQQRVAIARALASEAPVILADEPTGNLDEDTAQDITEILKESAHKMNKCVVVVTHSNELS